jgi:predicted ATPase
MENSPIYAFFYPAWGVVLKCESQDIESANKLGKLALNLVSMFNTKSLIGRSLYVVAAWLSESKYHVRETCQGFEKAIKVRSKTEIWKLSVIVTNTNLNIPILSGKSLPTSNMRLPSLATCSLNSNNQ